MPKQFASRTSDAAAVAEFLSSARQGTSALVIQGEAGIGKTTLWLDSCEQARERGFAVLSARAAAVESVLAYGSLADLLGGVDAAGWADLPDPQRLAVDRILLRASADGPATDQRAVAAGFLSVVEGLAEEAPVLVAIDDLQWLDPSSVRALAFAARRLSGPVGVLCTVRTDSDSGDAASWLQLPKPDAIRRIVLGPLSVGDLHTAVSERLGRSLSRPAMMRLYQVSGGNPFYAIELARSMDGEMVSSDGSLPGTLADLVRARVGSLDPDVQSALLATACLAAPTVELVAGAANVDAEHVARLLEEAEAKGIVGIEGNRPRFAHPLLARGVYTDAPLAQRRAMHRRCAELVGQPELAARHLALAATTADPVTLRSLDAAAETARMRGAPAAAAELLELAVGLGGDTPQRRIRWASHHFDAGEPERARALLEDTIDGLDPGPIRAEALNMLALVCILNDSFLEAAGLLESALSDVGDELALRAQILVSLSFALVNAGELDTALVRVEDAVTNAERLGQPHPLSQALSMRIMLRFMRGDGLDEPSLQRALELQDRQADISTAFSPRVQQALLLAWTGQLDQAHEEMLSIRRRCIEQGEESELTFIAFHTVLIEIWRGNFSDATLLAEDALERARQLNGDLPLCVALTVRAAVAAYAGEEHEARRDISDALAASQRCGSYRLAEWPVTVLGFLDVSLGNYPAALTTLEPLLAHLEAAPNGTEIIAATFVPDVVEALIHLGRPAEAEPLIEMLERNGRRLDRAWMLAVGARCRAMLLAARGDLGAAAAAAELAMVEHDRLPMPFERARTQLLLGQLQRRQRHKAAASTTLREALAVFEALDTPLWADRVRAELARGMSGRRRGERLTPSEQRVAEMAASGMTNRDIAAELFISPKTVEVNLSRIYRKLNIHSRIELYRQLDSLKQ